MTNLTSVLRFCRNPTDPTFMSDKIWPHSSNLSQILLFFPDELVPHACKRHITIGVATNCRPMSGKGSGAGGPQPSSGPKGSTALAQLESGGWLRHSVPSASTPAVPLEN